MIPAAFDCCPVILRQTTKIGSIRAANYCARQNPAIPGISAQSLPDNATFYVSRRAQKIPPAAIFDGSQKLEPRPLCHYSEPKKENINRGKGRSSVIRLLAKIGRFDMVAVKTVAVKSVAVKSVATALPCSTMAANSSSPAKLVPMQK